MEQELILAMFILNKKFNTPWDMIKYWGFSGPCRENCPEIEKITEFD